MDEYKDAMRQIDKYVEKEKHKKLEELKQFDIEIADKKAEINDLQQTTEWARKEKEKGITRRTDRMRKRIISAETGRRI